MRFEVIPAVGQPFIHEQDAPLRVGVTFFHPPHSRGKHGFFRVTAIEATDRTEPIVRVEQMGS